MRNIMQSLTNRASTVGELFSFLWEQRLWWMIPFVVVLVVLGIAIVTSQTSPIAPFMYAIF